MAHLVCQHLEGLARNALSEHQKLIKKLVRRRNGVYALYRKDKLYYVGLAKSLSSRLKQHLRDRHSGSWDRFSAYLTLGNQHLKELESLILRISQPGGNKQKGKFPKSEDIGPLFAKQVREFNKYKESLLFGKKIKKPVSLLKGANIRRMKLRAWYKGKKYRALLLKDGRVKYKGRNYPSPSAAAAKVVKGAANGWIFWKYLRSPGEWVSASHLRD